jgi:hypothetical protein
MDYGRLANKQKLVVLKAYYSSRFGALADSYLQMGTSKNPYHSTGSSVIASSNHSSSDQLAP